MSPSAFLEMSDWSPIEPKKARPCVSHATTGSPSVVERMWLRLAAAAELSPG